MNEIALGIKDVMNDTWPMIVLTCFVLIVIRLTYLLKNQIKISYDKEIMTLLFVIYILCLFQVVTGQDVSGAHGINITFFNEIKRYTLGSHLFYRNVIGNIILFIPFGFFISYYLNLDKKRFIILLTVVTSLVIETIQLKIGRAFDVDDILLNLMGGLLGYFLYRLIDRLFGNFEEKVKGYLTLLFILVFIISVLFIVI